MTVQIFERVSGDTGPPIEDVLYGVVDLLTVDEIITYLYRRRCDIGVLAATIVDPVTREISVDLTTWLPTALHGDWRMKHRVKWLAGGSWTWESGRADILRVGHDPAV